MSTRHVRPVQSTWLIIVLSVLILACAETQESGGGDTGPWATATITRTKGMVAKYFSAKVNVSSNYIGTVRFLETVEGTLPPGVSWNSSRGVFEGTPTLAGFYNVRVFYRDAHKGHPDDPDLSKNLWYIVDFELSMYDELKEEG